MSSPSKPLNISPRRPGDPADGLGVPGSLSRSTPYGTPDIRLLRAQYAGTPPPRNIPLRPQPSDGSLPLASSQPGSFQGPSGIAALRPTPSGTPDAELSNVNLDDLPDEEKARVLRRHLVSKEEREPPAAELEAPLAGGSGSRRSSSGANTPLRREDTEPFPIPYHTPGADVT
jgi:proton-coupled amino acid transporter